MQQKWFGPYTVVASLGKGLYRIKNQSTDRILKKAVHSARLKEYITSNDTDSSKQFSVSTTQTPPTVLLTGSVATFNCICSCLHLDQPLLLSCLHLDHSLLLSCLHLDQPLLLSCLHLDHSLLLHLDQPLLLNCRQPLLLSCLHLG